MFVTTMDNDNNNNNNNNNSVSSSDGIGNGDIDDSDHDSEWFTNMNGYSGNSSSTRMTLADFKAQWMIVLQRGTTINTTTAEVSTVVQEIAKLPQTDNDHETFMTTTTDNDNGRTFRKRRRMMQNHQNHAYQNQIVTKRRSNFPSSSSTSSSTNHNRYYNSANKNSTASATDIDTDRIDIDPYDCCSKNDRVKIPSLHDIVDRVVDDVIHQWRALDERKIISVNDNDGGDRQNINNTNKGTVLPKWYEKHIRLPEQFDYATIRTEPPPVPDSTIIGGGRTSTVTATAVVDLNDPTRTLSYHTELWKLFATTIPTRSQIEESIGRNHQLPNTHQWFHGSNNNNNNNNHGNTTGRHTTATIGISGGAILQGTKPCPTAEWDFYGLSRFRLNDRHDLPPPPFSSPTLPISQRTTKATTATVVDELYNHNSSSNTNNYCGLLRFECLRKQLRRSSTPDPNRMVLEFVEYQTLYDVHCAMVELSDDELWYDYATTVPISSMSTSTTNDDDDDDDDDSGNDTSRTKMDESTINIQHPEQEERQSQSSGPVDVDKDRDSLSSGYFFIENVFYTAGPVDYTTPIIQWLQTGTIREQKRRMEHLGIGPDVPIVKSMTEMQLRHLPTRLGVRYVHVHNGDVECAIFISDRRIVTQEYVQQIHQFPIIHDVWTPSYSIPECDACQNRVAIIATSTECTVTDGHKALCEVCCRQLRLHNINTSPHEQKRRLLERYTIWRGQSDLSAGASNEVVW